MAYSRWGNSTWYTFWAATMNTKYKWPTEKLKDQQVFEICDVPNYTTTYGELKEKGIMKVLKEVETLYSKKHKTKRLKGFDIDNNVIYEDAVAGPKNPSKSDLSELSYYLQQFMEDVDEHFQLGTFLLYEWYYPLRNTLRWKIQSFFQSLKK